MQLPIPLAPGARASADELEAQAGLLAVVPVVKRVLNAIPVMAALLNAQRQVVLANQRLAAFSAAAAADDLVGLRPGEIFGCVHSSETDGGCGTTAHCALCGALQTIVDAQLGQGHTQLCRIVRRGPSGDEPLDLEISATPIEISGRVFTLVCAADAAGVLRGEHLGRNILPQAQELALEIETLSTNAMASVGDAELRRRGLELLALAAARLSRLVRGDRDLVAAEAGCLTVIRRDVSSRDLLSQAAAETAVVFVDPPAADAPVETDPVRARDVLREMVLNAIEAAPPESAVTAGFRVADEHIEFFVRNAGEMPRPVQLQVFSRAYSSRAPGRGYGTYFAKLVTERYLGGSIWFRSNAEEGTTFTLQLPRARGTQEVAQ
jgi:Histidine kinase-, DNA gyrase B-, and HSP90-like ATPase